VVGFHEEIPAQAATYTILGPSLLQVLHELTAYHLRMMRFQATKWENIRYGTPEEDVERAAALLRRVVDMHRQVDARRFEA
jgi:hypothetical protein